MVTDGADHAGPEHAHPGRLGRRAARARLAARAGDADRVPGDGRRHGHLPPLLGARIPAHPRAAGRRHGDPAGGHLRRARRAGVPARARELPPLRRGQRRLPRGQRADRERGLDLLPVRRAALGDGDGGRARLRRRARVRRRDHARAPCSRSSACSRTSSTRSSSCRSSTRPSWRRPRRSTRSSTCSTPSPRWPTRRRRHRAARDRRRGRVRRRPLRLRLVGDRGAARRLVHGRAGPDGGARRPHRRRQVDRRQAARPLLRPHVGPRHDRRPRPARRDGAVAALAARDRAPGELPVLGHRARQHRVRPPRRDARGRRGRGRGGRRRRLHRGPARRATTPRSRSAARGSRSASASWSPSPAPCSPTRAS